MVASTRIHHTAGLELQTHKLDFPVTRGDSPPLSPGIAVDPPDRNRPKSRQVVRPDLIFRPVCSVIRGVHNFAQPWGASGSSADPEPRRFQHVHTVAPQSTQPTHDSQNHNAQRAGVRSNGRCNGTYTGPPTQRAGVCTITPAISTLRRLSVRYGFDCGVLEAGAISGFNPYWI